LATKKIEMTKETQILLVEDDLNLGFVIQDNLKMNGYLVDLATDGKEGLLQFISKEYHLCILDVMLPQKDGFTLAQDIRRINERVPILFLTAKSLLDDKISGFQAGGDDYLTKPFSNEEFLLRIKALLKRTIKKDKPENDNIFSINSILFDYPNLTLKSKNGLQKLTKKEAKILKILCENKGKVVKRDLILTMVWGDDSYFKGRSLDVFITKLRKHLKSNKKIKITNIHGVGFKLEY